jgi:hypothetical protein
MLGEKSSTNSTERTVEQTEMTEHIERGITFFGSFNRIEFPALSPLPQRGHTHKQSRQFLTQIPFDFPSFFFFF